VPSDRLNGVANDRRHTAGVGVAPDLPADSVRIKEKTMKAYQERVVAEKQELDEKLAKLKTFVFGDGKTFGTLNLQERDRLERQYDAMKAYSDILSERIAAF
jgi:uncharacterized protein